MLEAAAANRAARLKALDALAAGGLRPGQDRELELISALDLGTVPWSEVPVSLKQALELPVGDHGIDSLALNLTVAVQAKDYTNGHSVPLERLTTFYFLAKSMSELYSPQLIVATNASTKLPQLWKQRAGAEHRRYSAEEIEAWRLRARDWAAQHPGTEVASAPNSTSPRWPHQEACLRACRKFLASGPQQRDCFVQIATGGGKSLIMADLLSELDDGGRACVIVPKLDLMEQVAHLLESMALPGISRVGTGCTPDMDASIFVCVRNSAWRLAHLDFDLLVLDEAHHYEPPEEDQNVLDDNEDEDDRTASAAGPRPQASTVLNLRAKKRLFFSATLRWSRPDFDFGLRTAVRARIISDYTILVPFMTAGDPKPSLVQLIRDMPTARRILAFCNTVQEAKQFAKLLNAEGVQAGHYNGCTASLQRTRILEDFKKGPSRGGLRVLATVDVLSEGVDLPMADTCLFVEPRKGLRLRQCVGRVLRQHQQKVDALVVSPPIIQEADGGLIADGQLVRLLSELAGADPELRKSLAENPFGRVGLVDQRMNRSGDSPAVAFEEAATLLCTKVYPRALSSYLTADDRWQLGLAQLTQYQQEHGHCKVQHKHGKGSEFVLGYWVSYQRSARKAHNLTAQQVKQLDSLGFVWGVNKATSWEEMFELLKAYKQEHGHTRVPQSYVTDDGFKLGRWVDSQRKARKGQGGCKIDAEQIELLDSLGFVWGVEAAASWEENFIGLKAYKQEHGHSRVSQSYVADDGSQLGHWVSTQRRARKGQGGRRLGAEQIEQLDSLGFVWDVGKAAWEDNFEFLKAYKQEHGHTRVPKSYAADDGFQLGTWVDRQRQARKGQAGRKIDAEQIEQLDSLGFAWGGKKAASWEEGFKFLKAYNQEHGHTKVPKSYAADDGFQLGTWVDRQRQARKGQAGRKIDAEQIEQLDSLGFAWGGKKAASWEEGFKFLKAYNQEHGHTKVPKSYAADDGFQLGTWVDRQRQARKGQAGRKIDAEQIEQLDSLGFAWGVKKAASWEEGFKFLKAYKQEHGHPRVPRSYVADGGFNLGFCVTNQRSARKGQGGRNIDAEQIDQLDSLGFVWAHAQ
ncbi:unnamed protein product [Polarella glacialis]|uniref:Helicase n=1 Tax=Polarella glacialis TaxID=89957 RepID=A0A813DZ25_POLGL|nr:unnamed protein product [Polarella glacialis]